MPTYEYLCQTCSHRFEAWQKMIDEPLTVCPECGGHIRRVLHPAGIVFKGSGFYKTDHGNGAAPAAKDSNGETKKADDKATDKATTTSESKPAESSTGSKTSSESKASTANASTT